MTLVPRIVSVNMGHRSTSAVVRWHDADDHADGFPAVVFERTYRWTGKLHHAEVVMRVFDLAKRPWELRK